MAVWWNIAAGALLLFFGRRLFWFFVAVMGFEFGMRLVTENSFGLSDQTALFLAVGLGVVGALLSLFLQRFVLCVVGFLAGGWLLETLAVELKYSAYQWLAFFGGGVLGLLLVNTVFDWALVLLSTLTGATILAQTTGLNPPVSNGVFLMLFILGFIVQSHQLSRAPRKASESHS